MQKCGRVSRKVLLPQRMLHCSLILLFNPSSLPSVTLLVISSLLFSAHCVLGFFLVSLLLFLFLLLFFWHFFCPMFLSSCFFLSWSWKFPGNVFKALVSTHCPIQWCSAITPQPQKSSGLWINAIFLDSDLRSSFLYTPAFCTQNTCFLLHLKIHFQRAEQLGLFSLVY